MDSTIWAALVGILAGALGYWLSTFQMQPILRFREIKHKVLHDFIYYAQVINNDEKLAEEMKSLYQERVLSNRKVAASLFAVFEELPPWYFKYLEYKGLNPKMAAKNLIGYSNTTDYDQSHKVADVIRRQLGLPPQT